MPTFLRSHSYWSVMCEIAAIEVCGIYDAAALHMYFHPTHADVLQLAGQKHIKQLHYFHEYQSEGLRNVLGNAGVSCATHWAWHDS